HHNVRTGVSRGAATVMLNQVSIQHAELESTPGSALRNGAKITTRPIEVRWDPNKPIFAKPEFLQAVGDEYGWLGGFDDSDTLRCILPYTVVRKAGLRLVRFRVETMSIGPSLDVAEEQLFLNGVVRFLRAKGTDAIIPASNNALFRTYPTGAKAAPYGTYV